MSLLDKLKSNSTIKNSEILSESMLYGDVNFTKTGVPSLNIALSGKIDGGLTSGSTIIAGPSKHFKSLMSLLMVKGYLDSNKDAVCLFYDNEFGISPDYIEHIGIDPDRVIFTPVTTVEELKFDMMAQLDNLSKNDNVIFFLDSLGNIASAKEVNDALEQKSVADMSRAKQIKSFYRMITPKLKLLDIPFVAVNHTYATQEMFSKQVVSGGCLIEGTKLQTENGLIEIQNIKVGDKVKTLNGLKEVTHIWNPETLENGNPECMEIEFDDAYKVVCSENHPFLTTNGFVEAKNLTGDEDIVAV